MEARERMKSPQAECPSCGYAEAPIPFGRPWYYYCPKCGEDQAPKKACVSTFLRARFIAGTLLFTLPALAWMIGLFQPSYVGSMRARFGPLLGVFVPMVLLCFISHTCLQPLMVFRQKLTELRWATSLSRKGYRGQCKLLRGGDVILLLVVLVLPLSMIFYLGGGRPGALWLRAALDYKSVAAGLAFVLVPWLTVRNILLALAPYPDLSQLRLVPSAGGEGRVPGFTIQNLFDAEPRELPIPELWS